MTRTELQALVAELQRRYPDLELELSPHLTTVTGQPGSRYQIDVRTRVEIPLYVDPQSRMAENMIPHLLGEEIEAFREAVAHSALERARRERFYRRANHYCSWELGERPMGPWQRIDTRTDPSFNSAAAASRDAAGTGVTGTYYFPARSLPAPTRSPRKARRPKAKPEPQTLWDHLESSGDTKSK